MEFQINFLKNIFREPLMEKIKNIQRLQNLEKRKLRITQSMTNVTSGKDLEKLSMEANSVISPVLSKPIAMMAPSSLLLNDASSPKTKIISKKSTPTATDLPSMTLNSLSNKNLDAKHNKSKTTVNVFKNFKWK